MRQPSPAELRELVLRALSTAGVGLGTYTYPATGQAPRTTPAFFLGDPPEGVTVQGLEVLLSATPESTVISTFAGAITIDRYAIRAVAHDGQGLKPVYTALAGAFKGISPPNVLQATDRYPDQMVFTITP